MTTSKQIRAVGVCSFSFWCASIDTRKRIFGWWHLIIIKQRCTWNTSRNLGIFWGRGRRVTANNCRIDHGAYTYLRTAHFVQDGKKHGLQCGKCILTLRRHNYRSKVNIFFFMLFTPFNLYSKISQRVFHDSIETLI